MTKAAKDPLHYARDIVGKDPMATYLGIKVEAVRKEYARCSLVIKPQYLNALDRAHGISVYAVADQAFAVACCSGGYKGIALSFTVNFTRGAVVGEKIIAEATPLFTGRKVSLWKIQVTGKGKKLIASCEGFAYHKD